MITIIERNNCNCIITCSKIIRKFQPWVERLKAVVEKKYTDNQCHNYDGHHITLQNSPTNHTGSTTLAIIACIYRAGYKLHIYCRHFCVCTKLKVI